MSRIADFTDAVQALNIPIFGVSGEGPTCRIDFKPEATAQQRTDANNLRGTFDWNDQPVPKPLKFISDCTADGGVPGNAKLALNVMGLWVQNNQRQLALGIWNQLKASLTAGQITAIQTHASNNNITLP